MTYLDYQTSRARRGAPDHQNTSLQSTNVEQYFQSFSTDQQVDRSLPEGFISANAERAWTIVSHGFTAGIGPIAASYLSPSLQDWVADKEALYQDRLEQQAAKNRWDQFQDYAVGLATMLIGDGDPIKFAIFATTSGAMNLLVGAGTKVLYGAALANATTSSTITKLTGSYFTSLESSLILRSLNKGVTHAPGLGVGAAVSELVAANIKHPGDLSVDDQIDIFLDGLLGGAVGGGAFIAGTSFVGGAASKGIIKPIARRVRNSKSWEQYVGQKGGKTGNVPDPSNPRYSLVKKRPIERDFDQSQEVSDEYHRNMNPERVAEQEAKQEIRDLRSQDMNMQIKDPDSVTGDSISHPERQRADVLSEPFVYTDNEGNIYSDGTLRWPKEHPNAKLWNKGELPKIKDYVTHLDTLAMKDFAEAMHRRTPPSTEIQATKLTIEQQNARDTQQRRRKGFSRSEERITARRSVQNVGNILKTLTSLPRSTEKHLYTDKSYDQAVARLKQLPKAMDKALDDMMALGIDAPARPGDTTPQTIARFFRMIEETLEGYSEELADLGVDLDYIKNIQREAEDWYEKDVDVFMPIDGVVLDEHMAFDTAASLGTNELGLSITYDTTHGRTEIDFKERGTWQSEAGNKGTAAGNAYTNVVQKALEDTITAFAQNAKGKFEFTKGVATVYATHPDKLKAFKANFMAPLDVIALRYGTQAEPALRNRDNQVQIRSYRRGDGSIDNVMVRDIADALTDSTNIIYDTSLDLGINLGFLRGYNPSQSYDPVVLKRKTTKTRFIDFHKKHTTIPFIEAKMKQKLEQGEDPAKVKEWGFLQTETFWDSFWEERINGEGLTPFDSSVKGSSDFLNPTGQRVIRYTSAEAEQQAMEEFTDYEHLFDQHAKNSDVTAERLALFDTLGPNPYATHAHVMSMFRKYIDDLPRFDPDGPHVEYLKNIAPGVSKKLDSFLMIAKTTLSWFNDADLSSDGIQRMGNKLTHRISYYDDGGRFSDLYLDLSNFMKQVHLGSTAKYYIDDGFRTVATSKDAGVVMRDIALLLSEFFVPGGGRIGKKEISHLGLQMEDSRALMDGDIGLTKTEGKIQHVTAVMRWITQVDRATARAKRTSGKQFYKLTAEHINTPYEQVPPRYRRFTDKEGMTAGEWELLGTLPYTVTLSGGLKYYSPRDIHKLESTAARRAATKLNSAMHGWIAECIAEANSLIGLGTKWNFNHRHSAGDRRRKTKTGVEMAMREISLFTGAPKTLGFFLGTHPDPFMRAWKEILWVAVNGATLDFVDGILHGRPAVPLLETPTDVFLFLTRALDKGGGRGLLSEKALGGLYEIVDAFANSKSMVDASSRFVKNQTTFAGLQMMVRDVESLYSIFESIAEQDGTQAIDGFARFLSTYPGAEYLAHKTLGSISDMFHDTNNITSNLDEVRNRRNRKRMDRQRKRPIFINTDEDGKAFADEKTARQKSGVAQAKREKEQRFVDLQSSNR